MFSCLYKLFTSSPVFSIVGYKLALSKSVRASTSQRNFFSFAEMLNMIIKIGAQMQMLTYSATRGKA